VMTSSATVQDVNRNGRPDVVFSLDTPICRPGNSDDEGSWIQECDEKERRDHITFALVLEGSDASILGRFPATWAIADPSSGVEEGASGPTVALAAQGSGAIPGFGLLLFGGALAAAIGLRRRR